MCLHSYNNADRHLGGKLDMDWSEMMSRNETSFWGFIGFKLLTAKEDKVEVGLVATEQHLNQMGIVHGGVLTAMMDQAMGTLSMLHWQGTPGVTTHIDVNFLNAMTSGELVATAHKVHATQRTLTLRAEIHNEDGILGCISTATFRMMKNT